MAPAGAARPRRTRVVAVGGSVVAAVVVAAAVLWTTQYGPPGTTPEPTGGSGAQATSTTRTAQPTTDASPTETTTDTTPTDPSTSPPRGFKTHRDKLGFSLAVPHGWTKEEKTKTRQVSWTRPGAGPLTPPWTLGVFLHAKQGETRKPLNMLTQFVGGLGESFAMDSDEKPVPKPVSYPGGQAAEVDFTIALKEFPGVRCRMYVRSVVRDDDGASAMLWFFAPEGDWSQAATEHVRVFTSTFRMNDGD
jgi:eukaryotic-like serine/threonine-protein kinase